MGRPSLTEAYMIGELEMEPRIEIDPDLYLALQVVIDDIASEEWKDSWAFSIDDVVQECWEHLLRRWDKLHNADWELICWHIRRTARGYCEKQRIDYMHFSAAYIYTPKLIREFMEEVVFCDGANCTDIDARADLKEAMTHLTRGQRAAVYKRYALREILTTDAEIKAESRAIKSIADRLNTGLRLDGDPNE